MPTSLKKGNLKNNERQNIRRVFLLLLALGILTLLVMTIWRAQAPRSGQGKLSAFSREESFTGSGVWHVFTTDYPAGYDIQNFQFFTRFEYFRVFDFPRKKHRFEYQGEVYEFEWDAASNLFTVRTRAKSVELSIGDLLIQLAERQEKSPLAQAKLTLEKNTDNLRVRFYIEDLTALQRSSLWEVSHLLGVIVVSTKAPKR